MKKVSLVLVGAQTYMCSAFPSDMVRNGETVSVDEDIAGSLLKETYTDGFNNVRPIFKKVKEVAGTPPVVEEAVVEEDVVDAEVVDEEEADVDDIQVDTMAEVAPVKPHRVARAGK